MDFNFHKLFKYAILCMILNRSYPYIKRDKKWYIQSVIMFGFYLISLWFIMYCAIHDLKNKDWPEACYKGAWIVVAFVVIFKYSVMLKYQKSMLNLIKTVKKDYKFVETLAEEEQIILMHYALKGQWVSKLWFLYGATGIILFPLKSVVLMIYYTIVNEFKFEPVIQVMAYPCAEEKTTNEWEYFIFMYLLSLWYLFFGGSAYVGFATLVPIFITHACGLLQLVRARIQHLFNEPNYDTKKTREKLKFIINQLQHVYSFVQSIEENCQLVWEITLKASSIMIPITAYQIKKTYVNGQLSVELIGTIISMMGTPSCLCYYGDLLIQTGENVREAIYMSGWEKRWDRSARATLLILLTRTMQPVAIRTMFRVICLDALADIFHQSYAIFNLMNAST